MAGITGRGPRAHTRTPAPGLRRGRTLLRVVSRNAATDRTVRSAPSRAAKWREADPGALDPHSFTVRHHNEIALPSVRAAAPRRMQLRSDRAQVGTGERPRCPVVDVDIRYATPVDDIGRSDWEGRLGV